MLDRVKKRMKREAFLTSPLSIIINPFYIIRSGLYKSISQIAPTLEGNLLDFGCGSKPYESLFKNVSSYVGVDIEVSGHNHKDSKVDIFYDGKKLPFPDNNFDVVVCFEVFEHVFNLEELLIEINRVLKIDGKLLISIPFAWDEHEIPFDFARYTSYGITHILNNNDFQVVELKKTTTYFLAIAQMFTAYLYQHVLPRKKIIGRLSQLFFIFPLTLISLLINYFLPKRYQYYSNSVILSKKIAQKYVH